MKRRIVLSVIVVLALAGIGALWRLRSEPARPATPVSEPGAPLMVDDLRKQPGRLGSELNVLGVVGGSSEGESIFGLIDRREVESCGTVECPEFLLPVLWKGKMPEVRQVVVVQGRLQKTSKGLVLEAVEVRSP